ncbi:fungal-specific transcription factor domain-containing protein [Aspergillus recurvatus]
MSPKRQRTVAGSCWQCKTRRVKCDLTAPECRRCLVSGASCSYGRLRVRWSSRPAKGLPAGYQLDGAGGILVRSPLTETNLAESERKALEYFQFAVWPLFSTSFDPCPPPIRLALKSQPVLLSMCELAEAHRAHREQWPSQGAEVVQTKRLNCLTSVRRQLEDSASDTRSLSCVLLAALLLYFLDGYIECATQSASTGSHRVGVRAIVDNLGGFCALYDQGHNDVHMLLSQFASTDLTRALLDGRPPCLPADIWRHIEHGTVWWEKQRYGETTLASIFHAMAEMAFYRQSVRDNSVELSMEQVRHFESVLQPRFVPVSIEHLANEAAHLVKEGGVQEAMQPLAFARAFQHSALIYLYRAICGLPARHFLVQQHVQSCLECMGGIQRTSKAHNCIVFPLYVAGAHVLHPEQQRFIVHKLDDIYQTLRFDSLLSIRAALEDLWLSPQHGGSWADMFSRLGQDVLVL